MDTKNPDQGTGEWIGQEFQQGAGKGAVGYRQPADAALGCFGKLLLPKFLNPGDAMRRSSSPVAGIEGAIGMIALKWRDWLLMEIMGGQDPRGRCRTPVDGCLNRT